MRTIYVLSLVTVAKINPPCFDKRWRYRVPPPRPFMSFCQCLSIINTDVCVEFYEILNDLSASKSPEEILRFDTLLSQSVSLCLVFLCPYLVFL